MVALITPTGGRATQIELCAEFMTNQDYEGKVLWVIVDDVEPVTTDHISSDFRKGWEIKKIYPKPLWEPGQNTQVRNLLCGLEEVKGNPEVDTVFIIEDDDYYTPYYLRVMVKKMKGFELIGQVCTVYYNPVVRCWMRNGNHHHASLFQTAFQKSVIPTFEEVCKRRTNFVDSHLFRVFAGSFKTKVNLFDGRDLAIGIKGLPGRTGIGMGHRAEIRMAPDPDFAKLKELIGEDYKYYL